MPQNLPAWATLRSKESERPIIVDVDAGACYPAILDEYRARYAGGSHPGFITDAKEWAKLVEDLNREVPSAYWLEVAYQAMKLDIVFACRTHAINIHVHDADKKHAQAKAKTDLHDRTATHAAGGPKGGKDARLHYQALRGFVPNFA